MSLREQRQRQQLFDLLRTLDLSPEDLDGFVHDAKSDEASSINNQGVEAQADYLFRRFGFDETRRILRDHVPTVPTEIDTYNPEGALR